MNNEHINFMALAIQNRDKKAMTQQNVITDNSSVIANMQKTIEEQKALIEQMRDALQALIDTKSYKDFNGKDANYSDMRIAAWEKAKSVLSLSSPVSEKAK